MKFNILLLAFTLSVFGFGQKTDSLIQVVNQKNNYEEKTEFLKKYFKENRTQYFNEMAALADFSYQLASEQKDSLNMAIFLKEKGFAYAKLLKSDSAVIIHLKSIDLFKKLGEDKLLADNYNELARVYRKLDFYDRALKVYDNALQIYRRLNDKEGEGIILNESGVVYNNMKDYEMAKERFSQSLEIQRERNDSIGIGYALEFLGTNYVFLGQEDLAEKYLLEALSIRQKTDNDFALMANYTALGEFYSNLNRFSKSNNFLRESNAIARKIDYVDIITYNYDIMVKNYENANDFEKAFAFQKKAESLKDSLFTIEKVKNIEELSQKYETAEKEKEIMSQRAELAENKLTLQKRNYQLLGLLAFALIIGLLGYLFYNRQKIKNRQLQKENELKDALLKIETQNKLQEQRLRISRDLHDNIGSQLTFIISSLDNLKYGFKIENHPLLKKLETISSFTSETIHELRDTIWAMNKAEISLEDLNIRIGNFIRKANSASEVQFSFNMDSNISNDLTFNSVAGMNIYRVIQEAVNNSIKYADAQHIDIDIQQEKEMLTFKIQDDGKGFDVNNAEGGNGLNNMKKRLLDLDSTIHINSEKDNGTTISFNLDIHKIIQKLNS